MGRVSIGFLVGILITACVSSTFPFKYYALDANSYDGKLVGPISSQDLLLKMCSPSDADKAPCMVLFTSEFLRLKESYMKCQVDLSAAQRGHE